MTDIAKIYQKRVVDFAQISKELQKKYNRFAIIRLIVFFISIFLAIFIFSKTNAFLGVLFFGLIFNWL